MWKARKSSSEILHTDVLAHASNYVCFTCDDDVCSESYLAQSQRSKFMWFQLSRLWATLNRVMNMSCTSQCGRSLHTFSFLSKHTKIARRRDGTERKSFEKGFWVWTANWRTKENMKSYKMKWYKIGILAKNWKKLRRNFKKWTKLKWYKIEGQKRIKFKLSSTTIIKTINNSKSCEIGTK